MELHRYKSALIFDLMQFYLQSAYNHGHKAALQKYKFQS